MADGVTCRPWGPTPAAGGSCLYHDRWRARRDADRAGVTIAATLSRFEDEAATAVPAIHGAIEAAVLDLLDEAPEAAAAAEAA